MQKSYVLSYKIENILSKNGLCIKTLTFSTSAELSEIESVLTEREINEIGNFKSLKRKKEYYYTRVLWKSFEINQEINYNEFGKPFLLLGHISITHGRNTVGISYSAENIVGIDIEHYSPKINLIKDKFISEKDRALIDINNTRDLTLTWSVKEAVYKMESTPGLSFKENIHVTIKPNNTHVAVRKGDYLQRYNFFFILFKEYVLTCCYEKDWSNKIQIE